MADFAPNALSRWVAGENTLGRRFFIESCAGAVVAGMAAQAAPAQTVAAVPTNFFPGFPTPNDSDQRHNNQCACRRQWSARSGPARLPANTGGVAQNRP